MARSQRAVNWQGSAGMHESRKNNPICWARACGAAGRAGPHELCSQASGNADLSRQVVIETKVASKCTRHQGK
jgi:hypothetical protein